MNAAQILRKARALNVELWVEGDMLRYRGKRECIAILKPELVAHKSALIAALKGVRADTLDMPGYPVADGPFLPYAVPLSAERAAALLSALRATIIRIADIERWPPVYLAALLDRVARQPAATLADDLAYFLRRLEALEVIERASHVGGTS